MSFAPGGAEALETLAAEPADVVVSDMRMPGMDGAQLLAEVRRRYPQVVRIVLSGHSEEETVLRSVGAAHQYLAKPCDPDLLKSVIERACGLREVLTHDSVRKTLSQMQSLPSLPQLYLDIMEELRQPDSSVKVAGEIISNDLGMSAKVLQLVNSAFFGLRRTVCHPSDAVAMLGLDALQSLVLSVHVFSQFGEARRSGLCLDMLQDHSLAVGSLAKRICAAEECDSVTCDHALTAGLLHDAGKLALAIHDPALYGQALTLADSEGICHWEAEQRVFGTSHAEAGAYLLGIWGLPDPIVEALVFHHRPGECRAVEFTPMAAVHVANALDHEGATQADGHQPSCVDGEFLDRLGVANRLETWRQLHRAHAREGALG